MAVGATCLANFPMTAARFPILCLCLPLASCVMVSIHHSTKSPMHNFTVGHWFYDYGVAGAVFALTACNAPLLRTPLLILLLQRYCARLRSCNAQLSGHEEVSCNCCLMPRQFSLSHNGIQLMLLAACIFAHCTDASCSFSNHLQDFLCLQHWVECVLGWIELCALKPRCPSNLQSLLQHEHYGSWECFAILTLVNMCTCSNPVKGTKILCYSCWQLKCMYRPVLDHRKSDKPTRLQVLDLDCKPNWLIDWLVSAIFRGCFQIQIIK